MLILEMERTRRDYRGMVAVEYALLAAVVASGLIVAAGGVATALKGPMAQIEAAIPHGGSGATVKPTPF